MAHVIKEQIYRDINTGKISQIRQEMSDGSVEWEWDGKVHPTPRVTAAEMQRREIQAQMPQMKVDEAMQNRGQWYSYKGFEFKCLDGGPFLVRTNQWESFYAASELVQILKTA